MFLKPQNFILALYAGRRIFCWDCAVLLTSLLLTPALQPHTAGFCKVSCVSCPNSSEGLNLLPFVIYIYTAFRLLKEGDEHLNHLKVLCFFFFLTVIRHLVATSCWERCVLVFKSSHLAYFLSFPCVMTLKAFASKWTTCWALMHAFHWVWESDLQVWWAEDCFCVI